MEVKEILEFLDQAKGYRKEGAKRLANKVLKGRASIQNCAIALKIFNQKYNEEENKVSNRLDLGSNNSNQSKNEVLKEPSLKLKSRWQSANGQWLESYKVDDSSEEDKLSSEDITKAIKDALVDVEPFFKIRDFITYSTKSMLVWTSDKHIGADNSDAQHNIPYNKEVFKDRMFQIADNIVRKSFKEGKFDTLVIADLGDAIDGQDGYTASRTHKLPQNLTNKEVFEVYINVHIKFIETLVKNNVAANYEFWFNTCSNHGGSYEYACHRALQLYIEAKYPDIVIKSFDKFIGHTKFKDVTYILTHGKDDKNRKFGLPLYPDPKTEVFIDNYLKVNKLSLDENIRLIKGDLHQSASVPCKNINRYRNVASIFGSSGWVMDNYGMTEPGCDYEIIDHSTNEIIEGVIRFK